MASSLLSSSSLRFLTPRPITSLHKPNPIPKPNPKTLNPISLVAAAAVAASALLLPSLHFPALASVIPPTTTTTTSDSSETSEDPERLIENHLALHPDDTHYLRALLDLKIKSNKILDAIDVLDRLVALEPLDKALPLLKTTLLTQAGEFDSAKTALEEFLSNDTLPVEAYHGLVMIAYRSGNPDKLEKVLERIVDAVELCSKKGKLDDLRDLRLLIAQVRVVQGRYGDAIEVYDGLLKEDSGDFRVYLCKGIVYSVLRKKEEAERMFEEYRKLVPKDHQYVDFFDEGMFAMKEIGKKVDEDRKLAAMKS